LLHCGVRFLLCEVFNYTVPLLTVHVLVVELYPATPRDCPDQFCLLRLRCILTWKLLLPRCSSRKSLCVCRFTRWFHGSCFVVLNARFARRDWIISSSTVLHSRRLAALFTSCGMILKSLYKREFSVNAGNLFCEFWKGEFLRTLKDGILIYQISNFQDVFRVRIPWMPTTYKTYMFYEWWWLLLWSLLEK